MAQPGWPLHTGWTGSSDGPDFGGLVGTKAGFRISHLSSLNLSRSVRQVFLFEDDVQIKGGNPLYATKKEIERSIISVFASTLMGDNLWDGVLSQGFSLLATSLSLSTVLLAPDETVTSLETGLKEGDPNLLIPDSLAYTKLPESPGAVNGGFPWPSERNHMNHNSSRQTPLADIWGNPFIGCLAFVPFARSQSDIGVLEELTDEQSVWGGKPNVALDDNLFFSQPIGTAVVRYDHVDFDDSISSRVHGTIQLR
ncbi:uncharacterized protein ASPGLDRAFT_83992 [Aspergillus glaucus CBS 516.65]|uniref:Uncharacterized protein n=1 Tax=Aspergillus glaucus CBS 516.65 TaxID=1160497 RepID=A0A1L9VD32_ASPGL|nr:hypothetical protein ASPGLDRAFT_83992 [Aspergillus glaucus CBS 516.65]OJJ81824.1 hypothetical protein ASPGLDRAFT_83992 [Aspergillus glaucus CBS 516.65]